MCADYGAACRLIDPNDLGIYPVRRFLAGSLALFTPKLICPEDEIRIGGILPLNEGANLGKLALTPANFSDLIKSNTRAVYSDPIAHTIHFISNSTRGRTLARASSTAVPSLVRSRSVAPAPPRSAFVGNGTANAMSYNLPTADPITVVY